MVNFCKWNKQILLTAILSLQLFSPSEGLAQKSAGPIGYELIEEIQDAPSKTYTIKFEVWSNDQDATQVIITPRTQTTGLEILTRAKSWKKVKRNRRLPFSVSAINAGKETRTLLIDIKRKTRKRTDTKTISVLVAPQ
jgi:hypothetical protein